MNSRILLAYSAVIIAVTIMPVQAVTISRWTFETSPPADLNDSATISGITADTGNGTASGVHASAATDWSTPAGNGSANSLNANNWSQNDYFQFQLSTVGHQNIVVNWDQTRSSTGPATFDFAYSLDGAAFTTFLNDYTVPATSWSSSTADSTGNTSFSLDLSSVLALNNVSTVYFRLIADSLAGSAAGTVRIDNFTVSGDVITTSTTVPDTLPFTFIAFFLASFLAVAHKIGGVKQPALAKLKRNR